MTRSLSPESRAALGFGEKNRLCAVALTYIRRHRERGATADEICAALNLAHNSIAPRLTELKQSGLIVELYDAGDRRVRRQTRTGCAAGVVIASEFTDPKQPPVARPLFGEHVPESRYPD